LQEIVKSCGVALAGARVIDFGCGTGLLTEQLVLAGAAVHGVDTSPAMLDVLDGKVARHRWTNVTTSAEPPATAPLYDLIACSSVCSFLDDYPGTVADLVSLLRPGGLFVQWDWERTSDDPHGLSRDEITDALERAGLVEISVNTGFSVSVDDQTMSPLAGHGRRPHNLTPDP
jgi:predicted TPR repeat methyltransferase